MKPKLRTVLRAAFLILAVLAVSLCLMLWRSDGGTTIALEDAAPPAPADASEGVILNYGNTVGPVVKELERAADLSVVRRETQQSLKPQEWHLERVENISNETLNELVQNLANFDDVALASSSVGGEIASRMNADFCRLAVHRLLRVRRLLDMAESEPESVRSVVRERYAEIIDSYEDVFADYWAGDKVNLGHRRIYEDTPIHKSQWGALASTYILAELNDAAALPHMMKSVRIHRYTGDSFPTSVSPISPAFTLHCMHSIIDGINETTLSEEARQARLAFLEQAEPTLAEPDEIPATAWDEPLAEYDVRLQVIDPQRAALASNTSYNTVSQYSGSYAIDGSRLTNSNGKVFETAQELFDAAEKFIELAPY